MNKLAEEFIKNRSLSVDMDMNPYLLSCIEILEESNSIVKELAESNVISLSKEVHWSILHDMYKRSYEYCSGSLSSFLVGQIASSEALCRTSVEGSVNLYYLSTGDSMSRQISYFKNYFSTERKQNITWRKSVEESQQTDAYKESHYSRIDDKNSTLEWSETMLIESLAQDSVDFNQGVEAWPSIFDRFKRIGKEVDYRTIYAALCSQAHNDAEDVLNNLTSRVVSGVQGMEKAVFVEQYMFTLYMVATAIKFHVEASFIYLAKFGINVDLLVEQCKKIVLLISSIIEDSPKNIMSHIEMA